MRTPEQPSQSSLTNHFPPGGSPLNTSGGAHRYGGAWTEIKLDAVMYFVECYTRALTPVGFDLWYVDAFAGSGDRQSEQQRGGIFEGQPLEIVTKTLAGSARRALMIEPPFQHFIFNEPDLARNHVLQRLRVEYPSRDIQVIGGDANDVIKGIFSSRPWSKKSRGNARGLVFLDPYALQVDWDTLAMLANTQAVDVWYLFPLRDVVRQLAHRRSGIGPKEARLDRVLSPRWRDLYSMPAPAETWRQTTMFEEPGELEQERNATQRQIEEWFRQQLQTTFSYASEPLPLLTGQSRQAFSLFLCVANPSAKAIDLAKHFHGYVMKHFARTASHRRSGRGGPGR
jgi:three-Cys-motif partner protein